MRSRPIGFLDSGVGGLSVVKEVMKRLPNEKILFIGDSARNPYGNRSQAEIIQYSKELSRFLMKKQIKMLVIACNTATAAALDVLKEELAIPVIGVIEPGSRAAVASNQNNEIGVIGTVRTIASNEHFQQIHQLNPQAKVHTLAVPKFVEIVENNDLTSDYAKRVIQEELKALKSTEMDTLILGCTHYPLLETLIQDYLGEEVRLIDPAIATTDLIVDYLTKNKLHHPDMEQATESIFYTTAEAEKFEKIARNWIPIGQFKVEKITVEELQNG